MLLAYKQNSSFVFHMYFRNVRVLNLQAQYPSYAHKMWSVANKECDMTYRMPWYIMPHALVTQMIYLAFASPAFLALLRPPDCLFSPFASPDCLIFIICVARVSISCHLRHQIVFTRHLRHQILCFSPFAVSDCLYSPYASPDCLFLTIYVTRLSLLAICVSRLSYSPHTSPDCLCSPFASPDCLFLTIYVTRLSFSHHLRH